MKDKFEQAILGLTAIFSIIVSVLDWFKLFSLPSGTATSLTLLGVGLITGYLVLERRSKLDNIENLVKSGTEHIISSLGGVDVLSFSDPQELYEYTSRRMREAKKTIDDTTFGLYSRQSTPAAQKAYEKYLETLLAVCEKKTLTYREIISFPPIHHIERAETMLNKNPFGYQLRFYELPKEEFPQPLSFMVIDSTEVLISTAYLTPSPIRVAVRHPEIAKLFQRYYDAIWLKAGILKDRDEVNPEVLQAIKRRHSVE